MSRSHLPQSDADRVAAAATAGAIAAVLWVILAFSPDPRELAVASVHAATARHVDEANRAGARDGAAVSRFSTESRVPAPSRPLHE